jgi:hypothetical protein
MSYSLSALKCSFTGYCDDCEINTGPQTLYYVSEIGHYLCEDHLRQLEAETDIIAIIWEEEP